MKAKLLGKQYIDFPDEKGNRIQGTKLHVCSLDNEKSESMQGFRVATIFTNLDVSGLPINSTIELVYQQILGSKNSRLVAVEVAK